jgi:hypothetical protein
MIEKMKEKKKEGRTKVEHSIYGTKEEEIKINIHTQ